MANNCIKKEKHNPKPPRYCVWGKTKAILRIGKTKVSFLCTGPGTKGSNGPCSVWWIFPQFCSWTHTGLPVWYVHTGSQQNQCQHCEAAPWVYVLFSQYQRLAHKDVRLTLAYVLMWCSGTTLVKGLLLADFPKWHRALLGVLVCISVAVIKYSPKTMRGGKSLCILQEPTIRGSQSKNSSTDHGARFLLAWFPYLAMKDFLLYFYSPGPCAHHGTTHNGLDALTMMPHRHAHRPMW